MKKKYFLLLLLLCCINSISAQMTDLAKLSKGRLYSSDVIKDKKNNIKGYFLLFETDKVAKETYELEYVVLDENLTKVTSGLITEMKYESWLASADRVKVSVTLEKNRLLLEFYENINGFVYFKRYRTLDVATNVLSEPFMFNKDSLVLNPKFDRKMLNISNNNSENIYFFNDVGMVVDSRTLSKKEKLTDRKLVHYDNNMKQKWSLKYNDIKDKTVKSLSYLNSDDEIMVFFSHETKNNAMLAWTANVSVLFIDSKAGRIIKEFNFPQADKYSYYVVDCKIMEKEVYLLGNYSARSKSGWLDDEENKGLFKFVINKETGKIEDSKYLMWENAKSTNFEISKTGKVKKEGYIYIHNMLLMDDGKILTVAETFGSGPIITNNMYLFELTENLSVNQVFPIEKFRNKYPNTAAHSSDIKKYGLFDFIDYQDLGDNEYLFFLNDNEKKSKNRNKSTLYGIVSYTDGKFNRQTLDLKTETSTIFATNAKKGYMMLVENFDEKNKPTEIRLEKINL